MGSPWAFVFWVGFGLTFFGVFAREVARAEFESRLSMYLLFVGLGLVYALAMAFMWPLFILAVALVAWQPRSKFGYDLKRQLLRSDL
jgi:hypothetical protein